MTNINTTTILANYTEEEQKEIRIATTFMAIAGASSIPTTDEEFKAFCDEILKAKADRIEKEKEAKEKRENKELQKATEMGLTIEEYKKYTNNVRNAKRVAKEIEELKKELARKQAYLKRLNKEALEYINR